MILVSLKKASTIFMAALVVLGVAAGSNMNTLSAQEANHAALMEELQKQKEHVSVWQRYPFVGIPLVEAAPSIDGNVEVREWASSARIARLLEYNKGTAVKDKTDIYLAYTPTHLYLAFQFERPESSRFPSEQDWFEFLLDTTHQHQKYYNGGFALDKLLWDGIGPNVDKAAWEPRIEYKSRATEWGWEGEIAIPFQEFGLSAAPTAGTIWGGDFLRNEHTPTDRVAIWSYRGKNWHAIKNMGHLMFTGKPVAIRADGLGWMPEDRQAGVKVMVSNFGTEPVTLNATMELRKADQPVQMGYYPMIESAMAEDLPAAIGSPLVNEVTKALTGYSAPKAKNQVVTINGNSSKLIQLVEPDVPGNYLASFAIRDGEQLLAGSLIPVEVTVPLAIKTNNYLYSANTVEYEIDLRRVSDKITDNSSLLISVLDPQGKEITLDRQAIKKGVPEVIGALRFKPLPDATLTVNASILDGDKVVAQNTEHLRVPPQPPWFENQLGKKKFVPEPFTPVQATGRQVQASTSIYNWSDNTLLPNIKVNGNEVLAAPIQLSFKDKSGAALPLKITSFQLKSKDIEQAVYEFVGDIVGKATLSGTVTVEYDGLMWYRLNLTPTAPVELSASALEFTLKKEFARLCTVGAAEGKTVYSGGVPAEGLKSAFSFAYWLGGMEGGVQWFAENQRNWFNADPKNVAQITADDKIGRLKVNFIDKPVTLDKPIEWSFGFIPTPSRVKPKEWGNFAFIQAGVFKEPIETPLPTNATWEQTNSWNYYNKGGWARDKDQVYAFIHHDTWQEIFGYPGTYEPERQRTLKHSVKLLKKEGIKTLVYAGWGMNTSAPEWRDYGMEMVRLPIYNSGYGTFRQEPSSMWTDWYLWKVAEMIKDYDIDGLYIDSALSLVLSENYTPGMRWTDETGKVRGSYPLLATREWMKRLYKMFHGELKTGGVIYSHQSPPAVMAFETMVDVRCPSEYAQTHKGEFDKEFLEFFIAKNGGEQYGVFSEITNKDFMGEWATKKTPQVYALAVPLNVSIKALNSMHSQGSDKVGNYSIMEGPRVNQMMPWLWKASQWVDKSTAEYLPWWKNAQYITASPNDAQVIHALWLQKGKKALLCVSNLKNVARKIDVSLQLGALGMKGITVEDAFTSETVAVEGGKLSVDVDYERFRLLKITAKP